MNFLSHYYFERFTAQPEHVLGGVLPDLLKNVNKQYNFFPQRLEEKFFEYDKTRWISEGWYRHVEIDRLFHTSNFFIEHTHVLRKHLDPLVSHLPIRASFLAHISLELLLDHLLLDKQLINPNRFYEHLENVSYTTIDTYLGILGQIDIPRFFAFYERFLESRYMLRYVEMQNLSHALLNICKRVWGFEYLDSDIECLTSCLLSYKNELLGSYMSIFQEIHDKLT